MRRMSSEETPCIRYDLNHYMSVQLVEMEEHRWYLGEKYNRPITDGELIYDWIETENAIRFNEAYMAHLSKIEQVASEYEGRQIPNDLVHKILED